MDRTAASTIAARRAAERWFLDRGLPSVITSRARLRAIWPRSAHAPAGWIIDDLKLALAARNRYRAYGTR